MCDSSLDNRSLTPPIRQGTKEGPTPSPPEMTAPHQRLCGLPGRDGRRRASARVAQAHRIPGDLLPHGPAGPAPVATGCVGARDPPDGLAGVDHLRHPEQRRDASRPAMANLGAVVAQLPGVRSRPGRGVRPEPRGHVLALGPPRPGRGGRGPRSRTDRTRRGVPLGSWKTWPFLGS